MDCTFKYSIFSGKLFCLIVFRECHFNIHFFTDLGADELLLKSRNERTGSDRQRIFLAFSAFKSFSVNKAFKIKCYLVFILNSPVCHVDRSRIALALFVDFLVNLFLCDSCRNFIHFQSFIFTECHLWFHRNLCCKDKRFSFLKLCDLDFWLGCDFKLTLVISFAICL